LHHVQEPDFFGLVLSLGLLFAEPGVGELDELGIEELELLLDGEEAPLVLVSELEPPLIEALPLTEPEVLGVVLALEEELGVVVSVALLEDVDGVLLVVAGDVVEVVLVLVPALLRSQPVTAAVATARTATRGMSLFMTSPFGVRYECQTNPSRGPGTAGVQHGATCTTCASATSLVTSIRDAGSATIFFRNGKSIRAARTKVVPPPLCRA